MHSQIRVGINVGAHVIYPCVTTGQALKGFSQSILLLLNQMPSLSEFNLFILLFMF